MSIKSVYLTSFYVTEAWVDALVCDKKWSKSLFWSMFRHRIIWCGFQRLIGRNHSVGLNKQILRTIEIISQLCAQFISVVPPRHDQPSPPPPIPPHPTPYVHNHVTLDLYAQFELTTFKYVPNRFCCLGCVPLRWSGSGSVIQDNLDHGATQEPMKPVHRQPILSWVRRDRRTRALKRNVV